VNLKDTCITIAGLGLMGASLGLALKEYGGCREVVGLVRRAEAVTQAEALGVVDWATLDPAAALGDADIVVFSTPIRVLLRQLGELAGYCKSGAVITDMGSTKQEIMQAMDLLPERLQPVGSHPMCGKEVAGMAAAEATLYNGAPWILTPLRRTDPAATQLVQEMAEAIGAKPQTIEAQRHDNLVATISHLPYTLAAALTLTARDVAKNDPAVWGVAAGGFRDTSRVAASDVTMMLDILMTNREAVGHRLAETQVWLDKFAAAIAASDEPTLREMMESAAEQRQVLFQ
jgi:prephenate dehydrogenase